MSSEHRSLAQRLARSTGDELRDAWRRRFFTSPLRLATGHAEELAAFGESIAERLAEAAAGRHRPDSGTEEPAPLHLVPGSPELREVEKTVAFAGASGSTGGATGYDVAALLLSLRDTIGEDACPEHRAELGTFFEWLLIVALDAHANAARESALERAQGDLERGTPVVLLPGELPAAFLVGRPEPFVLQSVFARLVLVAARTGARALVLDGGGLTDAGAPAVQEALEDLFRHGELRQRVSFFASGLADPAGQSWREVASRCGARLEVFERSEAAISSAMAVAGYRVAPHEG